MAVACKKYFFVAVFTADVDWECLCFCVSTINIVSHATSAAALTAPDDIMCIVTLPRHPAKRKPFSIYMSLVSLYGPWAVGNQLQCCVQGVYCPG